jgi:Uma2 family endonuclease
MSSATVSPSHGLLGTGGSVLELMRRYENDPVLRRLQPKGIPLLYEDEGLEMGETTLHRMTCDILVYGWAFHFAGRADCRAFSNLNLYYSDDDPNAYASPDAMVVEAPRSLPAQLSSYRIGEDGPAPVLVAEVLSFKTYQEGDLSDKPILYAALGVEEYILIDVSAELLPRRLLLLRRQEDGTWAEEQDADGGITSRFGFRLVIEDDGHLRVLDAKTGKRYRRPLEAQAEADQRAAETAARRKAERKARTESKARAQAEEKVRALEAELARLRGREAKAGKKTPKRRRKP